MIYYFIFILLLINDDSFKYYKKYYIDENKYIINDVNDMRNPVKMFNSDNSLIKSICAGNGPGELSSNLYKTIVNDKESKYIYIWDQAKQVLNTYDYDLNHIDSFIANGSFKNLAIWIEFKKEIVFIENDSEDLYSFKSIDSDSIIYDVKYSKSFFNNYALRQNPMVFKSNGKLYISFRYLNVIHVIDNKSFNEIKIGDINLFKKYDIDHVKYELPIVGINPLGVIDVYVNDNDIYTLYSEKTFSKLELFKFFIKGIDEYKKQKIVEDIIVISKGNRIFRLSEASEYIYSISNDTLHTTYDGKNIISIIK